MSDFHFSVLLIHLLLSLSLGRCDTIGLDGKDVKSKSQSLYTHAQKMRASMAYAFRHMLGFGSQMGQRSMLPTEKVQIVGNPSLLEQVSHYMVSLHC